MQRDGNPRARGRARRRAFEPRRAQLPQKARPATRQASESERNTSPPRRGSPHDKKQAKSGYGGKKRRRCYAEPGMMTGRSESWRHRAPRAPRWTASCSWPADCQPQDPLPRLGAHQISVCQISGLLYCAFLRGFSSRRPPPLSYPSLLPPPLACGCIAVALSFASSFRRRARVVRSPPPCLPPPRASTRWCSQRSRSSRQTTTRLNAARFASRISLFRTRATSFAAPAPTR